MLWGNVTAHVLQTTPEEQKGVLLHICDHRHSGNHNTQLNYYNYFNFITTSVNEMQSCQLIYIFHFSTRTCFLQHEVTADKNPN